MAHEEKNMRHVMRDIHKKRNLGQKLAWDPKSKCLRAAVPGAEPKDDPDLLYLGAEDGTMAVKAENDAMGQARPDLHAALSESAPQASPDECSMIASLRQAMRGGPCKGRTNGIRFVFDLKTRRIAPEGHSTEESDTGDDLCIDPMNANVD